MGLIGPPVGVWGPKPGTMQPAFELIAEAAGEPSLASEPILARADAVETFETWWGDLTPRRRREVAAAAVGLVAQLLVAADFSLRSRAIGAAAVAFGIALTILVLLNAVEGD